jgi:hypothetical protein
VKLRACAAVGVVTLVTIAVACSSRTTQPPIDTNGGTTPEPGGGTPATVNDASDVDGGTVVAVDSGAGDAQPAVDAANNCHFGTCAGCCTPPDAGGQCVLGTTNAQCGVLGNACLQCLPNQTCTATNGCQ